MSTEIMLLNDEVFTTQEVQVFENQYLALFQNLAGVVKKKKVLENEEKIVKEQLEKLMDEYGIKSLDNQFIKIIRVAGSSSTTIDLKKLEEQEPDLFKDLLADYPKTTTRKASVRFDVK